MLAFFNLFTAKVADFGTIKVNNKDSILSISTQEVVVVVVIQTF